MGLTLLMTPPFWAKWTESNDFCSSHPLVCHLVDTAHVAHILWEKALPRRSRKAAASLMGLEEDEAALFVAWLAALHDLGKATPTFQSKAPAAARWLADAGLSFPRWTGSKPHGVAGVLPVTHVLQKHGIASETACRLAVAVCGHHGQFPQPTQWSNSSTRDLGDQTWAAARDAVACTIRDALGISDISPSFITTDIPDSFVIQLAGLVSVADWIASAETYFPFLWHVEQSHNSAPEPVDLTRYSTQAQEQAQRAVQELGWRKPELKVSPHFFNLFPDLHPRPLQVAIEGLACDRSQPALVIVEAPMGEGKTEAAWMVHAQSVTARGDIGAYVALPSQATSNQMLSRVRRYLEHHYGALNPVNLQLLHSNAWANADFTALRLAAGDGSDRQQAVVAEEWFTPKKRALLSAFGVGTIDQALLAVLQCRHNFVRLFGLSGKTVIIDEVHAYDTYMSTLLDRLLYWLSALGVTTVLLSATLPQKRRKELLATYADPGTVKQGPYPRITQVSHGCRLERNFCAHERTPVTVCWTEEKQCMEEVFSSLADGGCAVWIANTVSSAQRIYTCMKTLADPGLDLRLFHARFPLEERQRLESDLLDSFGPPVVESPNNADTSSPRPWRSVLIATQVVEQSLDLDFDLMVSELAPTDLVLQRVGRLHRHQRQRPDGLARPKLFLISLALDEAGLPDFGSSGLVYSSYVLLRSWLVLAEQSQIRLPQDIEGLVEATYSDEHPQSTTPGMSDRLAELKAKLTKEQALEALEAKRRLIPKPGLSEEFLEQEGLGLTEDGDPALHSTLRAMTRLGGVSVTAICLFETSDGLSLDSEGRDLVDLKAEVTPTFARKLIRRSVPITHPGLVALLASEQSPPSWSRSAFLRHARLIVFDSHGCARKADYNLRLDPALGLVITREGRS